MTDPIRVGLIGANAARGWASRTHLPALTHLPGFELVAVATTRQSSADETAARYQVPHAFDDAGALIDLPEVDLVAVSVKVPDHAPLVRRALEAGKDLFCEWPLGANLAEAESLLSLAQAKGSRHVVGLQGRMSPMANFVRDLLAEEYLGELLSISLSQRSTNRGARVVPAHERWAIDRKNGATVLSIATGHCLDVLRYMTGPFAELQATIEVRYPDATLEGTGEALHVTSPDIILVQGETAGGAYLSLDIQGGHTFGGSRVELSGSKGRIVLESDSSLQMNDDGQRLFGATGAAPLGPLEVPARYRVVPDEVPPGTARNTAALYLALAAQRSGGPVASPGFAEAVELHRLLDALEQASANGGRARLA